MIDTATEQLLTLQQAADRMPVSRGGRPVHLATIWRWIKARKLEGVRLGDRWLTSVEALQRYAERQTLAALGNEPIPPAPVQTAGRRKAIERRARSGVDRDLVKGNAKGRYPVPIRSGPLRQWSISMQCKTNPPGLQDRQRSSSYPTISGTSCLLSSRDIPAAGSNARRLAVTPARERQRVFGP